MSPTLLRSETLVSQGQAGAAEHRRRGNVGRSDTTEIGGGPLHVDVTRMTRRAMRACAMRSPALTHHAAGKSNRLM